ncbi:sodium:solute symporter [bacterium]|nr:sodium:solute symporter [bacterium]
MVTYFAVGSGKFISTFLGIPDIGRIEDPLTQEEVKSLESSIEIVKNRTDIFLSDVTQASMELPMAKSMERGMQNIESGFLSIKEHPNNITKLSRLSLKLKDQSNLIKSIRRSDKFTQIINKEPDGDLSLHFNDLSAQFLNFEQQFQNSACYSIFIRAQFLAAFMMIFLAMIYTVASGLYGVVWTDVFQGALIFGTIFYICVTTFTNFRVPEKFFISIPMKDGTFQALSTTREVWTSIIPSFQLHFPADSVYSIYNLFGIAILFYLIKVTIEGSGGTSGYMIQRYFASKSDREAGLLSLFWTFLLSFRWPFIASIAVMGVVFGTTNGVINDPETVLPIVINKLVPAGVKGFLVAGLIAAAMSTFDSTVNAGASYWVKDIYQAYLNPKASEKKLMLHSRWASVIIVIFGLIFSLFIKNINEIWGWITMSIGAGMIIPTLVRWYWWRLNGYGFAIGTAAGMIAAIIQRIMFPHVPEYVSFAFASSISFAAMLIGTYATRPTDDDVLFEFYKTTRPFGFWRSVRKRFPESLLAKIDTENRRDKRAIWLAVPWQLVMFLMWITLIMRQWVYFFELLAVLIALSASLYFMWFRHLSKEVKVEAEV